MATLAFTRSPQIAAADDTKRRTVFTIETDALSTSGTTGALNAFCKDLDAAWIPYTLHWGQKLGNDAAWVRKAYGPALDAWLTHRRRWLPTPDARRLFSNDLLDVLNLSG